MIKAVFDRKLSFTLASTTAASQKEQNESLKNKTTRINLIIRASINIHMESNVYYACRGFSCIFTKRKRHFAFDVRKYLMELSFLLRNQCHFSTRAIKFEYFICFICTISQSLHSPCFTAIVYSLRKTDFY